MNIDSRSMLDSEEAWTLPENFYSCWNARGLYNPLQFVLRLRPDLHGALKAAPQGWVTQGEISEEQLSAFSTYLHETVHWWQHVGSTTGLFLSLLFPAQSHINHSHLIKIVSQLGPMKSIKCYGLGSDITRNGNDDLSGSVNIALNNWHDIEFYRWLIIDPKRAREIVEDELFVCVGHSYKVAIGAILWLLSSTIDRGLEFLPDPRKWEQKSTELRENHVDGFYKGSPVALPPIGAREVFEGQARFSQLQYLYFSSSMTKTWDDFEKEGMLSGVYVEAFRCFIDVTGLPLPQAFHDSAIGLYLLVCDISINPSEGFAGDFPDLENMILVHDPGMRFLLLCLAIKSDPDKYRSCINDYSAEEYWRVSEQLCALAGFEGPNKLIKEVASWPSRFKDVADLIEEDRTFNFSLQNLPVRVFVARFIQLLIDKAATPEFFCWPAVWMTAARNDGISRQTSMDLFEEHRALFLDKEDGDVYPRTFIDRDEDSINRTFNTFYAWVTTYELTRQWIVEPGEFNFDFSWLSTKYTHDEVQEWASARFEEVFGVNPRHFKILS